MSSRHNEGLSKENLHFDDQSKQIFLYILLFSEGYRKHVLYVFIPTTEYFC